MAAQPAARPARPGMICRLRASTGAAGLRLAHACFLLLLLTLAWGPHWPFSHFGIVAPPAGLLNAAFDLADLLLVGILAGWGIALVTGQDRVTLRPYWVSIPLLCFALAGSLAIAGALDQAAAARFAVRTAGLAALYSYLRSSLDARRLTPAVIAWWLAPGLGLNGLLAVAQAIHQDPLGLSWLGEPAMLRSTAGTAVVLVHGSLQLRAFGVLPHPNVLGGLLAAALPLVAGPIVDPRAPSSAWSERAAWRWAWPRAGRVASLWRGSPIQGMALPVCLALMAAGVVVSFSRSAWLGLLVGALYLIWRQAGSRWRPTRRAVVVGAGIALVLAALLAIEWDAVSVRLQPASNRLEQYSIQQRLSLLSLTFKVIAWRPLTGVGGNNVARAEAHFQRPGQEGASGILPVHNTYLLAQAELGPLGAGAWLALMLAPFVGGTRRDRVREASSMWRALTGCSLLVVAIAGLFDFYIWANEPVAVLWIIALAGFTWSSRRAR